MATEVTEDAPLDAELETDASLDASLDESPAPSRKINLGDKKIKIILLLALVMSVEAAGIYFVLPKPTANTSTTDENVSMDNSPAGRDANTVEVPIGSFMSTNRWASNATVIHVTFKVVAIVAKSAADTFKKEALPANEGRVRQAILKVVRSSSLQDLSDPELGVIKRKIREEVNKTLHKTFIIEVVIPEYKSIEQ